MTNERVSRTVNRHKVYHGTNEILCKGTTGIGHDYTIPQAGILVSLPNHHLKKINFGWLYL